MTTARSFSRCLVRPAIGEPLAADAFQECFGALGIAMTGLSPFALNLHFGFAGVVSEVELGNVALQVLCADMVEASYDAALEDREVALNGVVGSVATRVFASCVIHNLMANEHGSHK